MPAATAIISDCFARDSSKSASCQPAALASVQGTMATQGHWSDFWDWSRQASSGSPPLFYKTMYVLTTSNVSHSAYFIRGFNILLLVGLLAAIGLVAPRSIRQSVYTSALVTLIPLGAFLISSTTPNSWTITGVTIYWAALLTALEAPSGKRRAIAYTIAAIAALMASGSRADGAAYIIFSTALVLLVATRPHGSRFTRENATRAVFAGFIIAMSAYFFLFAEQKRFGVSGMDGPSTVTNAANTSRDLAFAIMLDLPTLWTGAIGGWGLGWLDTPMPAVVTMLTSAVFVAVSIVSFRYYDAKKVIAVLLIVAALIAIPFRTHYLGGSNVGESLQPRYLLPLLLLLPAFAVLHPVRERRVTLALPQWVALAVMISIAHAIALHFEIRRYTTGLDVLKFNLNSDIEWWPVPMIQPMELWGIASIAFLVTAFFVFRTFDRKLETQTGETRS